MNVVRYYEIAPNQIIRSGNDSFTYSSKEALAIGTIVQIEVGKKLLTGLVISEQKKPDYPTKEVTAITETYPIPKALVDTAMWMSSYYSTPLASVLQTLLPRNLTTKRREKATTSTSVEIRERTNFVLNKDQLAAVKKIQAMTPGTALLHGVTGSGKTAVYIDSAKRMISSGKSVIILVPEIALTSQLIADVSHHFDDIILTHSRQTEAQRHRAWRDALMSKEPRVVIGPRSALFMPVPNLGLIVIDECHEPSFKQEQSPRYSALRVASKLAEFSGGKALLGSATPLVADYFLAEQSGRPIITMPTPAQKATAPTVSVIDMTKRTNFKKHRFLSDKLLSAIDETLLAGKQILLFHNRRGTASTTLCENCGWQAGCPRCFVPLSLHADNHELRCHICGFIDRIPTSCPVCHHADIIHKGIGTKLIESEVKKLFPKSRIARYDGDTTKEDTLDANYSDVYGGKIDIIIGTQVIAKGLDLPHLRTVGVVQADAGLGLPDYSTSERTFQLLSQVIGRVGRSHHATNVIIQSYQPSHPAVVDGVARNYSEFYTRTLALRQHTNFPPFCFLLQLTCVYKTEAAAIKNSKALASELRQKAPDVEILGPTPAFYERTRDTFRWQLVVKAKKRQDLLDLLQYLPPKYWQFELDPISLL